MLRSVWSENSARFWTWERAPKVRQVGGKRGRSGGGRAGGGGDPNIINGLVGGAWARASGRGACSASPALAAAAHGWR